MRVLHHHDASVDLAAAAEAAAKSGFPASAVTATAEWSGLLGGDPIDWLLASDEPAARWLTLTAILGCPRGDRRVIAAHQAVLADATTKALVARLPDWEAGDRLSGHMNPTFAPNLLNLLADMGVHGGDIPDVERLLDDMAAHQEDDGRFPSYAAIRGSEAPVWGSLLCDSHAIVEALVRYGRADDPRVRRGLERIADDLANTPQGRAWPCLPHSTAGWRGPGRKRDFCPMVTLQALRTFARLSPTLRPPDLVDAARVALRAWRVRGEEKPYIFGHGRQFKTLKWPPTWYSALAVLDALAGYPMLWRDAVSADVDRRAIAELLACLIAYNVGANGRVTPQSTYRGFEELSFGQKKLPSPFATARILATLAPYVDLVADVTSIDVTTLSSSRGGTGTAMPPRQPRR